jgi:hypothetical protein
LNYHQESSQFNKNYHFHYVPCSFILTLHIIANAQKRNGATVVTKRTALSNVASTSLPLGAPPVKIPEILAAAIISLSTSATDSLPLANNGRKAWTKSQLVLGRLTS